MIKTQLQQEKQVHIDKAALFYSDLKAISQESKINPEVEVLSFDYQQNVPLPHVPCGDVFYKRQIWCYKFCIYSEKLVNRIILCTMSLSVKKDKTKL